MKQVPEVRGAFVQCAGQFCPERSGCLRYAKRGGQAWASFDIERQRYPDCQAVIPIKKGH